MEEGKVIRNAGLLTIVGALIGIGTGIARAADASIPSVGSVSLAEILTVVASVSLFFGAFGLLRSGAAGNSSAAKAGYVLVFVGLTVALIYEVSLVLQAQPSELPGIVAGLLVGLGMLTVGRVTLQAGIWPGWRRFAPLIAGSYPLVMVFAYPLITSIPAIAEIGSQRLDQGLTAIWFLCWLPLGMALWSEPDREEQVQPRTAG